MRMNSLQSEREQALLLSRSFLKGLHWRIGPHGGQSIVWHRRGIDDMKGEELAGTTGLEPAASAVTATIFVVTH